MTSLVDTAPLDRRPVVIAIAGSNGAGKTSFYRQHVAELGFSYINADDLARELGPPRTRRPTSPPTSGPLS